MDVTLPVLGFLIFWLLWCSLPFISSPKLTLFPQLKADTLIWRVVEWHVRFPVLMLVGYVLDTLYSNRPHESYVALDFYAIIYTASLVFSVPALLIYLGTRQKLSR